MVEKNQNMAAKTCFDCFHVPLSKLPPTDAHFGPPRVRRYKAGQWPTGEDPALPQPGQTCGVPSAAPGIQDLRVRRAEPGPGRGQEPGENPACYRGRATGTEEVPGAQRAHNESHVLTHTGQTPGPPVCKGGTILSAPWRAPKACLGSIPCN